MNLGFAVTYEKLHDRHPFIPLPVYFFDQNQGTYVRFENA
jgi:hypothetical protein